MKNVELAGYKHIQTCKEALVNEDVFSNFKKDKNYTIILEHTSADMGDRYIALIFNEFKGYAHLLDWGKLRENDSVGNPNIINFLSLKNHILLDDYHYSPSTIYYIYRGLHIINKMLKKDGVNNILEIGGGYGGQCKLLIDMCVMLNVPISSYGIIDLEYASKLQNKYLNLFSYVNVIYYEFENINHFSQFEKYDTLISIYALGEFAFIVQDFYINNIVNSVPNHYVIWNTEKIHNYYLNDDIVDEVPKTGRFNKLIIRKKDNNRIYGQDRN